MGELKRTIVAQDVPEIEGLLDKVFGENQYLHIERLGGMTNHSYKIIRNDKAEYLVRIPGEGTEEMINREDEKKSTELACRLGIDSELLYFDKDGKKVMRFITNPQPMNEEVMRRKENIAQAAAIFRKLHNCGEDTGVRFEVFEMAAAYEKIIQEKAVQLYDDYGMVKNKVMAIKDYFDQKGMTKRVPSHNDTLTGNWVLDEKGKLWLIDWEYSGMNEPMWDLSCTSIECVYTEKEDQQLLHDYFQRPATMEEKKQFIATKMYVDYLWTLWGLTRVPFDGKFMQDYADARYARLKKNIKAYERIQQEQ